MTVENISIIPSTIPSVIQHGNEDPSLIGKTIGSKNCRLATQPFLYQSYLLPSGLNSSDTTGHYSAEMMTIAGTATATTPYYPMMIQQHVHEPPYHNNSLVRWPSASFTISSAKPTQTPSIGSQYQYISSHPVPTLPSSSSSPLPRVTGYLHSNSANQTDTSLLSTQAPHNVCISSSIDGTESTVSPVMETSILQNQYTPIKRGKLSVVSDCDDVQLSSITPLSRVSCPTPSSSSSSCTSSLSDPSESTLCDTSILAVDQDRCITSAIQAELKGEPEKAIVINESILTQCPSSWETLCKLGDTYLEKQDFALALNAYQAVSQHNPYFLEIHPRIGKCFLNLGELHQAYLAFQKTVTLLAENRQTFDLWADIGLLYEQYSMFKESKMAYERAILFEASHKRLFEVQCRLGMICKYLYQLDEALKWFEAALLTFETSPQMVASHADVHFQIGQIMNARKMVGYLMFSFSGFCGLFVVAHKEGSID